MDDSILEQLREAIRRHFAPRRHSALLVAIIVLFAVRPLIGDAGISAAVLSIAMLAMLLVALYNIQVDELVGERETLLAERRRRSIIGWALALPATAERLAVTFMPSRSLLLSGSILWLLLLSFITWNLLRDVLRQKEVTRETISMSISVYLLLGFTWLFSTSYSIRCSRTPSASGALRRRFRARPPSSRLSRFLFTSA